MATAAFESGSYVKAGVSSEYVAKATHDRDGPLMEMLEPVVDRNAHCWHVHTIEHEPSTGLMLRVTVLSPDQSESEKLTCGKVVTTVESFIGT